MRVFQISSVYPKAVEVLTRQFNGFEGMSFSELLQQTIRDGFDGSHILEPAFSSDPSFQFVWGNLPKAQAVWAKERGWRGSDPIALICAQIEEHRSDVIYSLDPLLYPNEFIKRLPGCVKHTLCWRAAAPGNQNFNSYQAVLSNFPPLNRLWETQGMRAFYFSPSQDRTGEDLPEPLERDIDICFIGSVLSGHRQRIALLDKVASLSGRYKVQFHLMRTLASRLASLPLMKHVPGNRWHLPPALIAVSHGPLFGKPMFAILKRSKVVINISTDSIGRPFRGNMRCFEAMSCGCTMVADAGLYPEGMENGQTMVTFEENEDIRERVVAALETPGFCRSIGSSAHDLMALHYSKERQWQHFQKIVGSL